MLEFKLKRIAICLDFSFFAVVALYLLLDESGFGITALFACAMHETAHFVAMAIFGVRVNRLTFYGAGIRITADKLDRASVFARAVILSAGCAVNFLMAVIFRALGEYAQSAVNLFIGIFNLLPMGELDGAGLLKLLVLHVCKAENIDRAMRAAGIFSALLCAVTATAISGKVSFTLITTALYFIFMACGKI